MHVHTGIKADASKAASVRLWDPDTHSCALTPDMSDDAVSALAVDLSAQCVALGFALPRAY